MLHHRIFGTALLAVCAAALTCGAYAQTPLRIGAINPYSGPLALYGDEDSDAWVSALENGTHPLCRIGSVARLV